MHHLKKWEYGEANERMMASVKNGASSKIAKTNFSFRLSSEAEYVLAVQAA